MPNIADYSLDNEWLLSGVRKHFGHANIKFGGRECDAYCYSPMFQNEAELQEYCNSNLNPLHGDFRNAVSVRANYAFGDWK